MNQCNDWQTVCTYTNQRLSHLLLTKLWADCTFLVGGDQPETITAHKFVLAMSSPVFEAMFYGSMAEGSGPIKLPDVQPEAFKIMLKFLYTDQGNIPSYEVASELYCAAQKYMIPFIQERCSLYMQYSLTPKNACFAYEFANLFNEKAVLKAALKTIKRKTKDVLKEGTFYDASISTVAAVFSQSELHIDSEVDLLRAAEKYAETLGLKTLKRDYATAFESEKESRTELRKKLRIEENEESGSERDIKLELGRNDEQALTEGVLQDMRKAITNIRFLTLSAQEMAAVASSTLLTQEEALTLMLIVAGVNEPLPEGFCDNKTRRGLRHRSPDCGSASPTYSPTSPTPIRNSQQDSVSRSEVTHEAIVEFSVQNFKTRKRPVFSPTFNTGTYEWRIVVQPGTTFQANGEEQKTLSVFVECLGLPDASTWQCRATVNVELTARGKQGLKRTFRFDYNNVAKSSGFRNWVPWSTLCENGSGFVVSNMLKVAVYVSATYATNKTTT